MIKGRLFGSGLLRYLTRRPNPSSSTVAMIQLATYDRSCNDSRSTQALQTSAAFTLLPHARRRTKAASKLPIGREDQVLHSKLNVPGQHKGLRRS